ncbi:MAG: hypothetical protein HKP62_01960 [Sulfurovum sp.]|nr:hypothetical protein [Sulfurovum sp.]NNJ44757.1 hypothetical protein [Sulfurovum sp.]
MKTIEELEKELATANKLIKELAEKDEAKCKIRIIHIVAWMLGGFLSYLVFIYLLSN